MKTIDEITAEITAEAATAYELSMGSNWHRLVLTAEGEIYWAEEVGQSSMSEAVWNGTDRSLMHFQGQTWSDSAEEAYEMIEAGAAIAAELEERASEERGSMFEASDGIEYRRGEKYYGYDPQKWFSVGDLLSFSDANQDTSEEEYMREAIERAEEFWASRPAAAANV